MLWYRCFVIGQHFIFSSCIEYSGVKSSCINVADAFYSHTLFWHVANYISHLKLERNNTENQRFTFYVWICTSKVWYQLDPFDFRDRNQPNCVSLNKAWQDSMIILAYHIVGTCILCCYHELWSYVASSSLCYRIYNHNLYTSLTHHTPPHDLLLKCAMTWYNI